MQCAVATNAKWKIPLSSGHCTGYTITRVLFYSQLMNIIIVADLTRAMPVEENADYFKQESVGVGVYYRKYFHFTIFISDIGPIDLIKMLTLTWVVLPKGYLVQN